MRRYEQARDAAVAQLDTLERLLPPENAVPVAAARLRLERDKFVPAVVGEFSSGKSFLLNALLGKFRCERHGERKHLVGLLAKDINPSTAAITELEYASVDEAYAVYEGGRRERIPLDRLNRFIAVGNGDVGSVHEELGALIATIEGQAESHMARLARLERASADVSATGVAAMAPIREEGLLAQLFGKGR